MSLDSDEKGGLTLVIVALVVLAAIAASIAVESTTGVFQDTYGREDGQQQRGESR